MVSAEPRELGMVSPEPARVYFPGELTVQIGLNIKLE
jgi:hypothetical protein